MKADERIVGILTIVYLVTGRSCDARTITQYWADTNDKELHCASKGTFHRVRLMMGLATPCYTGITHQIAGYERGRQHVGQEKYSLWVMPSGPTASRFSQIISHLAAQYGAPTFPPHVTLLGSIETELEDIVTRSQALALQINPYSITLGEVGYLDQYFRALFVSVDLSEGVMAAYQQAKQVFPEMHKPAYQPHLSLLYGNFTVDMKEHMVEALGRDLKDEFEANALHLWTTGGAVNTWHRIGTYQLRS